MAKEKNSKTPPVTSPPTAEEKIETPPVSEAQGADKDARLWGMLTHLTSLIGFLGIPFGNIAGPLVIWLVKRNEIPFVDAQGKESLNFQITMTICALIAIPFVFILIGIPLILAVLIVDVIFVIIASVKANNGEDYKYPLCIRLIK